MKSVDFKSFVIGSLLVLLILCVVGAEPWVSHDRFHRFEMGMSDNHAFILDTATGQTWGFATSSGLIGHYTKPEEFFAQKTSVAQSLIDPDTSIP